MGSHLGERIGDLQPDLIRRTGGGWLAVSPSGAVIPVGVTASTEEEAKEKFRYVYLRWLEIIRDHNVTATT